MAEYLFDAATWQEDVKIITAETLRIPGLEMFGNNCTPGKLRVLAPHIHATTEFLYFANGAQKYYIEDKEYTLKGNQVLIVDAEVVHSTGENPFGRHESLWFRMDVAEFAESLGITDQLKDAIVQRLCGRDNPIISLQKGMYSDLQSAFAYLASDDAIDRLCGYSKFITFITELIKCAKPENSYSENMQKVILYINENIHSAMPLFELAKIAKMSLSGFKQKFRREIGITPREYINLLKIEKAKEYLAKGISVTETAFMLDFSSSSYFSVLFKQIEDISPSDYAKKITKNRPAAVPQDGE